MKNRQSKCLPIVLSVAAALSACGGSNRDSTPAAATVPAPTAEVPATASFSVVGLIGYINSLIASPADTLEPVGVAAVTAPTDDTIEPSPIA